MQQQFSSALLEKAVAEFAKLPGVGRKTALRLVLFMLRQSGEEVEQFVNSISKMKREVKYCRVCHNIAIRMYVQSALIHVGILLRFVW